MHNDFFVDIGPTLAKWIPNVNKSPLSYIGSLLTESIYLEPVTEKRNQYIDKPIKGYSNQVFDDTNSMSLKISSEILVKPLTNNYNLSLTKVIFPSQLKIANVIPLYKSDDHMLFDNDRPVSALWILLKVSEKNDVWYSFNLHWNISDSTRKSILHSKKHLPIWRCFHSYKLLKMVNMLLVFSLIFKRLWYCWLWYLVRQIRSFWNQRFCSFLV